MSTVGDIPGTGQIADDPHAGAPQMTTGWRRWLLRGFVIAMLVAGAAVVTAAAVTIAGDQGATAGGRKAVGGVLMPDDAHFRDIAGQLLARPTPERLAGMTIVGASGTVAVQRHRPGSPSFLSSYLNPNALSVIARAIAARGDPPVTVDELRLEVLRATGRQRWRLHGSQGGALWRATINPNGTDLRIVTAPPPAAS
ncbi:hypothetical protein NBH00_23060 [Paraconexibacter antarcticus]|uniref:Uncharacterized protein n=1 Tax=Paraconexibacter antarcticus TaxID=2949664 RepID=A0ABY5DQA6_9ACTN|nr:hypothetical protein [Paraconexibacter antarcticus]UTI64205.1 hypothetical protein NBH00_23060 [Paraconexibacter antarcticus]